MTVPKRGDMFLHAHWIREIPGKAVLEWPPETCIITTVSDASIFYRTLPDGDLWRLPAEMFEGIAVKEWVKP
jgi:hypothetical protein